VPRATTGAPRTIADVAERLMAAYERSLPLSTISRIVCELHRQFADRGTHDGLPALVHRVADERLRATVLASRLPA
jgi:hypothetical protein